MGLMPRPRVDYRHEGVRRIFKLMLPALFGVSVSQINLLLDTILASFLETGSISWLYYSDRLAELPLGIIAIAISTVILPKLSRHHASQSQSHFRETLDWALRFVMILGVPAAIALIVLAAPLLTVIFHYGEMSQQDVLMAAASLWAYASGLMAFMLIKVLAPGYFSRQDMKTPVRVGIYAMVANMLFNLLLIWPFSHTGLALATALSSWLNAFWLYRGLIKRGVFKLSPGWGSFLLRVLIAVCAMVVVLLVLNPEQKSWFEFGLVDRVLNLAMLVSSGIGVYFVSLYILGLRPVDLLKRHSL